MLKGVGVQDVLACFVAGTKTGWAAGVDGFDMGLHMPGWRFTTYAWGELEMRDQWGKDPETGLTIGNTTIYPRGTYTFPLWGMTYGLRDYPKETLPCLRHALLVTAQADEFWGGRGRDNIVHRGLRYRNIVECIPFCEFRGREWIEDARTRERLGEHQYWGGSKVFVGQPRIKNYPNLATVGDTKPHDVFAGLPRPRGMPVQDSDLSPPTDI